MGTKMCQHVTDELSDHNISFSAKQTMSWEALYENSCVCNFNIIDALLP